MKAQLDKTLRLWAYTIQELTGMNAFFSLEKLNDQFYRRLLLRNFFSVIETYIFICRELVRIKMEIEDSRSELSWQEQAILTERKAGLNSKGEVTTSEHYQNFIPSLRFSLNIFAKIFQSTAPDFSNHQFGVIQQFAKRRNEVTHPKNYDEIIITDEEILTLVPMLKWFMDTHTIASKGFNTWLEKTYPTL